MTSVSRLQCMPEQWIPCVFQYLSIRDLNRLEVTCSFYRWQVQQWLGDAHSQRIRPLPLGDYKKPFHTQLHQAYGEDLLVWTSAFVYIVYTEPPPTNMANAIDYYQKFIPERVIHHLFTSANFCNSKFSRVPIAEQLWKNTVVRCTPAFFSILDKLRGLCSSKCTNTNAKDVWKCATTQFNRFADRHKLVFFEHAIQSTQSLAFSGCDALIGLSTRALSLIVPQSSKYALQAARYVLWTVWGPNIDPWVTRDPLWANNNEVQVIPWMNQVVFTEALIQALPNHLQLTLASGVDRTWQVQSMFTFQPLQYRLWAIHPDFHMSIVATDKTYFEFNVYRNKHLQSSTQSLRQILCIQEGGICVQYRIMELQSHTDLLVKEVNYDVTALRIVEPPEVMCWKYLPIETIQCRFKVQMLLRPQVRGFQGLQNAKLLSIQRAAIEDWVKRDLWQCLGIFAPGGCVTVLPEKSIVNNCIWTVFYSVRANEHL